MTSSAAVAPKKRTSIAETNRELRETLEIVSSNNEMLAEALGNAVSMLRQEDVGWATPSESGYHGLSLSDIKHWSDQIRTSLTGTREKAPNPHMRNGLMLRHSFIWDGGINYEGVPGADGANPGRGIPNVQKFIDDLSNQRLFFNSTARRKREHALYSDGMYVVCGDNKTKKLRPIPLHELTDTHRDEQYEDDIIAYRWTRQESERNTRKDGKQGALTGARVEKSYWIYVDWFDGDKADAIKYNGRLEPVLKDSTIFDLHANRPDGAPFGSPDAISALVWARIIRDLIMNGVKMQDALAMFAFKATAESSAGQKNTALELGSSHSAGSAAVLGGQDNLVPLSSAGKGYDFGSIGFVVATMAASLHVSGIALSANTALAGSSYGAAKTLDLPGRMAMTTRRAEHIEFDERVLRWMGAKDATAYFNSYDDSTDEYRAVQAAMLAWQTGTLTPEGFRAELEIIYGRKLMGEIPKGVIVPNNQAQIDAEAKKQAAAIQAAAPDQGRSNGAGDADHASDLPAGDK